MAQIAGLARKQQQTSGSASNFEFKSLPGGIIRTEPPPNPIQLLQVAIPKLDGEDTSKKHLFSCPPYYHFFKELEGCPHPLSNYCWGIQFPAILDLGTTPKLKLLVAAAVAKRDPCYELTSVLLNENETPVLIPNNARKAVWRFINSINCQTSYCSFSSDLEIGTVLSWIAPRTTPERFNKLIACK